MLGKVTLNEIQEAKTTCLGSKIISKATQSGVAKKVFQVAIPMEDEQLRDTYTGKYGFKALTEFYQNLNVHAASSFATFFGSQGVEEYAVFEFHTPDFWVGLDELDPAEVSCLSLDIFKQLLQLLKEYQDCSINANEYQPLYTICKDSVLLSFNEDNTLKKICLIPVLFDQEVKYAGLPCNPLCGSNQIADDMFMAAYLYLSLKYPNGEPFREDENYKYDCLAEQCLSLFKQRRPSLETVLNALNGVEANTVVVNPAPSLEKVQETTSKESLGVRIDDRENDFLNRNKHGASQNGKFQKSVENLKSKTKKGVERFSKKLSRMQGKVDDAFSTEQGDNTPDEE